MDVKKILEKEGIQNFDEDIRLMSSKALRKYFRFKTRRKLSPTRLIKNLIWQAYTWISDGRMEPIEGNIWSFWYISVKPVLSRLGLKISGRKYPNIVYMMFVELVTEYRLFRYADFGFIDDRMFHRTIGRRNGHLVLFIEKDGMYSILRGIAQTHHATAIALNGFPSYLTSEFLIRDMARAGLLHKPMHLFGLVDYDPAGYWIEQEFPEQLRAYGVEIGSGHSIIKPSLLPPDLLELYKYRLRPGSRTKNWLAVTGGIGGKAYGLEADALGGRRVREAFEKAMEAYLSGKDKARWAQVGIGLEPEREEWLEWLRAEPTYRRKM